MELQNPRKVGGIGYESAVEMTAKGAQALAKFHGVGNHTFAHVHTMRSSPQDDMAGDFSRA